MSDEEKPVQKPQEPDRDIIYYYSRERRLDKASDAVRDMDTPPVQQGFIKTMFMGKNRSSFFLMIIILLVFVVLYFGNRSTSGSESTFMFGGNKITLTVQNEDLPVFTILKNNPPDVYAYTGAIDISIYPVQADENPNAKYSHRIFFTLDSVQAYSFVLPFDSTDFIVILESENETAARTVKKSK